MAALIKSPFPVPPTLPPVNVHNFLFGREIPDHVCQIDGITGEKRAKNEFVDRVLDAATGLSRVLGPDDEVIAILSDNCMDYITLVHSALVLTTPITFFSTFSTPSELAFLLRTSRATRFFVGASYFENARKAAKVVGLADDRIYILQGHAPWGRISFQGIIDAAKKGKWERVKPKPVNEETLAYLVFSSGTSGLPKAVKITHYNITGAVFQFMSVMTTSAAKFGPPPALPGGQLPTGLAYLPLYHSYGLFAFAFRAFLVPATTVFMPKWDLDTFLRLISQYKVNSLSMIPSLIHQLVHSPQKLAKADFSSIAMYTCGAAALPKELGEGFLKLLPPTAKQIEGYGLTEATIAVASPPPPGLFDNIPTKPGSLGVLYPGLEARILLDDGSWGSYGQIGELCVKGPTITQGYWQNEQANKDSFVVDDSGRWLRTGDRFRADEDSTLWFEDRAKDTLKVSGMQVSPQEIELCLLSHPKKFVIDTTVAGVPGTRTSDEKVPRAWVVLSNEGRQLLGVKNSNEAQVKQELDKWVAENLSKYKWLRGGMEFVEEIPKSATGKVLRRQLVDDYIKKHGSATDTARL